MSRAAAALSKADAGVVTRLVTSSNSVEFDYDSIAEAFPQIDPGIEPCGTCVLLQIKQPKSTSKGGIILPTDPRSTDHYNTQVAKVIALGPLAFKTVKTTFDEHGNEVEAIKDWAAGRWYQPGDYVWVAKYGGDRFSRTAEFKRKERDPDTGREETVTTKEEVIFAFYKAKDVHGKITGDPLKFRAYLD